jgi:predicted nucleic acid-binding protein
LTRDWWDNHRHKYETVISRFVVEECGAGDSTAAEERSEYLKALSILEVTRDVESLAKELAKGIHLPSKAVVDAYHISTSAINGVQYLLTWNCTHIANPALRHQIDRICRDAGYEPPVICTPQELMGIGHAR